MKLFLASSLDKTLPLLLQKFFKPPQKTKVIFIANAADPFDDKWWVDLDRQAFLKSGFEIIEVDLKNITEDRFTEQVQNADILHICGGSVFYLLSLLKKSTFHKTITGAVRKNKIFYTGTSAGSVIVSPSLEIYKYDPEEKKFFDPKSDFSGLNFVNFLIVPHCNNPEFVEANKAVIEHSPKFPIPLIFIQDNQVVWVEDNKFEILSL